MSLLKGAAQAAFLLVLIPLLILHNLASLARTRRSRRAVSTGNSLTVVVPYPPGDRSGASKAMEGLLSALAPRFSTHVVPLYELRPPENGLRDRLSDLLTWPLHMPLHCRPFLLAPRVVTDRLPPEGPILLEFISGSLFLLFGRRPPGLLVLRDHEVPCRRLLMEARAKPAFARPLALLRLAAAYLITFDIYRKADRIVTLTPEDGDFIRRAFPWFEARTAVIPATIELPPRPPSTRAPATREILFLANFYHRPNVDGLLWFLDECAPHLKGSVTLHLVGLNEPLRSLPLDRPNVDVVRHGFVEDVATAFAHVPIAVAPLVSGGGIRIKNLYLASLGKAIVTTPLANQGIDFVAGIETMVCDSGAAMAAALETLAADPESAVRMGAHAREAVHVRFGSAATLDRFCLEVFGVTACPALSSTN